MNSKNTILASAIFMALVSTSAQAVQFDGFLTAGGAMLVGDSSATSSTDYQGITDDIKFDVDSRFGLQISSDISKDMAVVGQLLARGSNENYNAIIEWAYVDYEVNKSISIRAGKIKQPVYLVNDYVEVGYAYPWIRPPAEVYSNNPLNTVNGMELLYQIPIGKRNNLSIQPYIGTNSEEIPGTGGAGFFEATNILGVDIKFSGRGYSIHASHFKTNVQTQGALVAPASFGPGGIANVSFDLNATGKADLTSVGFTADISNVVAYAEWQERDESGGIEPLFTDQDSYYVTLGYRYGKWLPHFTYASIDGQFAASNAAVFCATAGSTGCPGSINGDLAFGDPALGGGAQFPFKEQSSVTLGLRYELNDSAALKIEHQLVDIGSGNDDPATGFQNFGLYTPTFAGTAAKRARIVSFSLDVIF